jgi:2',3'-cyclic-nucleotide 2'-phosphodiesterase/3'-nucleotidase
MKKYQKLYTTVIYLFVSLFAQFSQSQITPIDVGSTMHLAIMETTDLHGHVRSYDYLKNQPDLNFGIEKTSTLIHQVRKINPNHLLIDNGDTFEGSAITDYQILTKPIACKESLSIYKVMNYLNFDASVIGNHEFNYGLETLSKLTAGQMKSSFVESSSHKKCSGPLFPLISGNIFDTNTHQTIFKPYLVLNKIFIIKTKHGELQKVPFKVGILGFTPPKILTWDKNHLAGKVYSSDSIALAKQYINELKNQGVQLIIVASHSGLDHSQYTPDMENNGWHLSLIEGVDVLLLGHSHQLFPGSPNPANQFNHLSVKASDGTVNGVPTLMPNFWGSHLGVIEMDLMFNGEDWVVDKNKTIVKNLPIQSKDNLNILSDNKIINMTKNEHNQVIQYLNQPLTISKFPITSYFTDLGESSVPYIINEAQTQYVRKIIQERYEHLKNIPITSMASSFRNGFAGPNDFTVIPKGRINRRSAMDLYVYPNTIAAVLVNGEELKNWLEKSSQRFNQIDPSNPSDQLLTSNLPSYNFDMLTDPDFNYEIDVSQPISNRINNLKYKNHLITKEDQFIVATNNYRASGGGNLLPTNNKNTIFIDTMSNKEVVINYLASQKKIIHPPYRSWKFTPINSTGKILYVSKHNSVDSRLYLKNLPLKLSSTDASKTIYEVHLED